MCTCVHHYNRKKNQPGPVVILAVTKKFDTAIQNLQVPSAFQKKKTKKLANSNQSNYTRENYLHIASIIIILNNGYISF